MLKDFHTPYSLLGEIREHDRVHVLQAAHFSEADLPASLRQRELSENHGPHTICEL